MNDPTINELKVMSDQLNIALADVITGNGSIEDATLARRVLFAGLELVHRSSGLTKLQALASACLAYHQAIKSCADDPEKMDSFCTASGDDLNALYQAWLDLAMDAVRCCHKCGCTDENACAGGCSWVSLNLCSACATTTSETAMSATPAWPFP